VVEAADGNARHVVCPDWYGSSEQLRKSRVGRNGKTVMPGRRAAQFTRRA
jgi:hypothetical protein